MGLEEELLSCEKEDANMSPSDKVLKTTNCGEKEKSGEAVVGKSKMESDTHTWETSALSEQDYSIDQKFLSKIDIDFSNGMRLKAGDMLLPALVQVADVQRVDEKMSKLELCDGKHITSQLAPDMDPDMVLDVSFFVLTRHEVSKFSVIKIDSASIGYSSNVEDREHFQNLLRGRQNLLGKPTFNNDSYAFMVLEDITVVEEGTKIGHLLWDQLSLGSDPICELNGQIKAGMYSDLMFPFLCMFS